MRWFTLQDIWRKKSPSTSLYSDTDTKCYYAKYGLYLDSIDRGGLCIPFDRTVQLVIFCYIFFINSHTKICRKFVCHIFNKISTIYSLDFIETHFKILSNIFIKNYAILSSPKSSREAELKVLKLS